MANSATTDPTAEKKRTVKENANEPSPKLEHYSEQRSKESGHINAAEYKHGLDVINQPSQRTSVMSMQLNRALTSEVILWTEGRTDWQHMKRAFNALDAPMGYRFQEMENDFGDDQLLKTVHCFG